MEMMMGEILETAYHSRCRRIVVVGTNHCAHFGTRHDSLRTREHPWREYYVRVVEEQQRRPGHFRAAIARCRGSHMAGQLDQFHVESGGDFAGSVRGIVVHDNY